MANEPTQEATEEFQQEFAAAHEEVITDLEDTRATLHGSIDAVAEAVKQSLLGK